MENDDGTVPPARISAETLDAKMNRCNDRDGFASGAMQMKSWGLQEA
jgi:hypothetical protein